jgi:hypothetical protein
MSKDRSAVFLAAMAKGKGPVDEAPLEAPAVSDTAETAPAAAATVHPLPRTRRTPAKAKAGPSRAGLKHFGGYLDDDTLEKIALLRIRLKMDNSALIRFAIDELHAKHKAKRAFGDA